MASQGSVLRSLRRGCPPWARASVAACAIAQVGEHVPSSSSSPSLPPLGGPGAKGRPFSAAAGASGAGGGGGGAALVELRTYAVKPAGLAEYLRLSAATAALRRELSPGWMGFWTTETGGSLGEVKHLYRYEGGWEQREQARARMQQSREWSQDYIPQIRPLLDAQHSMILVEAHDCLGTISAALGALTPQDLASAPSAGQGLKPVFEFRRYELLPGYSTMPTLKKHMLHGLPSRMAAQKCGQCIFMGHSDVGLLNVFVELWRYDSTLQCTNARRAARASSEWQDSIAGIATVTAEFRTEYLRASSFSPAQ